MTKTDKPKVVYPPSFFVSVYSGPSKILIPFLLIFLFLLFGWPFGTFAYYSQTGFWAYDDTAPINDMPVYDEKRELHHMIYMIIVISLLVLYFLGWAVVKAVWTLPSIVDQHAPAAAPAAAPAVTK